MTREESKALLPVIQAFSEGRIIECSSITDVSKAWREVTDFPIGMIKNFKFRIKPESKFRPFKDAEECWNEMKKHQPFGFTKFKNAKSGYYMVTFIARGAIVGMNNIPFSYENMFDSYTFADGTPFGVKIEEE